MPYHVYIMASRPNGTLYVGMTSDLVKRVYEHKNGAVPGLTKRYGVHRLVYFEETGDPRVAAQRERNLKRWNRAWKVDLIEKSNPDWVDLSESIAS